MNPYSLLRYVTITLMVIAALALGAQGNAEAGGGECLPCDGTHGSGSCSLQGCWISDSQGGTGQPQVKEPYQGYAYGNSEQSCSPCSWQSQGEWMGNGTYVCYDGCWREVWSGEDQQPIEESPLLQQLQQQDPGGQWLPTPVPQPQRQQPVMPSGSSCPPCDGTGGAGNCSLQGCWIPDAGAQPASQWQQTQPQQPASWGQQPSTLGQGLGSAVEAYNAVKRFADNLICTPVAGITGLTGVIVGGGLNNANGAATLGYHWLEDGWNYCWYEMK
jgi:hypothetical protein